MEFIDLKTQYRQMREEILEEIDAACREASFILGPRVEKLERELAEFTGAGHVVSCASGTDALVLALKALGIGPGDEVITSPFTFFASPESIAMVGATPVFADIDPVTYNIDPAEIEKKITPRTKALMPVSIFGQMPDLDAINKIADAAGIPVIEDAAQSFGATFNQKRSGSLTQVGATSFFPAKPLGCYGDGGAVFCREEKLADEMRRLRNHGQNEKYKHSSLGYNSRLDALQAVVLSVKLKTYQNEVEARQKVAAHYTRLFQDRAGESVKTPGVDERSTSVWAQYCLQVPQRDKVLAALQNAEIPFGVYYPVPMHEQEAFAYLNHKRGDFPVTEKVSERIMAVPMHPWLEEIDQEKIVDTIADSLSV